MKVTNFLEEWNKTHTSQPSFQDAIEWADKTMLARICEWLENHDMTEHISVTYTGTCSISFDKQELINALCKAMNL